MEIGIRENQNLGSYLDLKILFPLFYPTRFESSCGWSEKNSSLSIMLIVNIILQLEQWALWQSDLLGIDSFDWVTCVGWILQIQTQDQTTARIPTWQVAIHHAQLLFQYYIWSWTQQTNENYSANNWISQGSQSKVIHSDSYS